MAPHETPDPSESLDAAFVKSVLERTATDPALRDHLFRELMVQSVLADPSLKNRLDGAASLAPKTASSPAPGVVASTTDDLELTVDSLRTDLVAAAEEPYRISLLEIKDDWVETMHIHEIEGGDGKLSLRRSGDENFHGVGNVFYGEETGYFTMQDGKLVLVEGTRITDGRICKGKFHTSTACLKEGSVKDRRSGMEITNGSYDELGNLTNGTYKKSLPVEITLTGEFTFNGGDLKLKEGTEAQLETKRLKARGKVLGDFLIGEGETTKKPYKLIGVFDLKEGSFIGKQTDGPLSKVEAKVISPEWELTIDRQNQDAYRSFSGRKLYTAGNSEEGKFLGESLDFRPYP